MSQQEFEPRRRQSRQQEEGLPKDEPAGSYDMPEGQEGYGEYQQKPAQVPWWARPQIQQSNSLRFSGIIALAVVVLVVLGGLGIARMVLGALVHLIGVFIGAIFVLFIFVFALVVLILASIWRAIGRAAGYDPRAAREMRRAQRRAARRYWRGAW